MSELLRFVRVVHRQGWQVEVIEPERQEAPSVQAFASREEALAQARSHHPAWIEVGEVVPASGPVPQHHRWTTLRRGADGNYAPSALNWGGEHRGEGDAAAARPED